MAGKTYKQIAQKHDVTYNEVLYLVKKKNWKRKSNLSKVKKGNQNAKGNKGGPGAEKGNTRALKTGEYETIYDDLLTDEEKAIMKQTELYDKKYQIMSEIKMLSIRERRMMQRIKYVKEGKDNYLRIFIDNDKGISLDDCEKVSNEINEILDKADYIKEQYYLEVSSPGIERVLRKDKHLEQNIGEQINIKLFKKDENENTPRREKYITYSFYHSGSFEFAGISMDKNNMAGLSNPRRLHYIFLSGS